MKKSYAKIIVQGSPISKSNFKLFNMQGRAILPYNSGKYHDRYALYEEEIALCAKSQNPDTLIDEAIIAVLKVYYKSMKRHPDTNNITKSIFDGIEKSGIIVNDAQVRKLIIEEFYDKENPRFELELFGESMYYIDYEIKKREIEETPIVYSPPPNKKNLSYTSRKKNINISSSNFDLSTEMLCSICGKKINKENSISANKGKTVICKNCFQKLYK